MTLDDSFRDNSVAPMIYFRAMRVGAVWCIAVQKKTQKLRTTIAVKGECILKECRK